MSNSYYTFRVWSIRSYTNIYRLVISFVFYVFNFKSSQG